MITYRDTRPGHFHALLTVQSLIEGEDEIHVRVNGPDAVHLLLAHRDAAGLAEGLPFLLVLTREQALELHGLLVAAAGVAARMEGIPL